MALSRRFSRYFSSWKPTWSPGALISKQAGTGPSVLNFSRVNKKDVSKASFQTNYTAEKDEDDKEPDDSKSPTLPPLKTLVAFVTKKQITDQHDVLQSQGFLSLESLASNGKKSEPLKILCEPKSLRNFYQKGTSSTFIYPKSESEWDRVLLVNLDEKFSNKSTFEATQSLREATYNAITALKSSKTLAATLLLPSIPPETKLNRNDVLETICNTAILSNHSFSKYLKKKSSPLYELAFLDDNKIWTTDEFDATVKQATVYGEGTVLARELANDRADKVTPSYMEEMARQLATAHADTIKLRVLDSTELTKENCHLFTAVGQGAQELSRLVIFEYQGNPSSDKKIALVGKGITFDTGGLNLKPTGAMEDMHLDMSGSATVLSTIKAAALLKLPLNLVGALALAENAIGPKAYKPHSIIYSRKGTSVEISNTDAEGRLVLADTLNYVQDTSKWTTRPQTIIDVATLTGACVHALGEYASGLFSNDDDLAEELIKAGRSTFERTWRLPIFPEHIEDIKGTYSDIRSTGKTKTGGACTAAAFLQHFIEKDVTWAHLDIAGPAMYSSPRKWMPKDGTGYGVQLLLSFLQHRVQK